ncbi:MAG: hypothetical protein MI861_24280, partial [Pirellulales bacterium]|nr:hypothetical protein [Pirellulales bacterium]
MQKVEGPLVAVALADDFGKPWRPATLYAASRIVSHAYFCNRHLCNRLLDVQVSYVQGVLFNKVSARLDL